MKIRHFLLLIFCFVVVFCSCSKDFGKYFLFREKEMRGEIRGVLHGVAFCAEIGQAREADGTWCRTVRFLTPDSLEGITVEWAGDTVHAECQEIKQDLPTSCLEGWILPLRLLFEPSNVETVQKKGKDTVLTLSGDVTLTLGETGTPLAVKSPDADFFVVWWETR